MIEIFETCQTKSIAKQTNRDESLIIRSILLTESLFAPSLYTLVQAPHLWWERPPSLGELKLER